MFDFFENLRKRPRHHRKIIAFSSSLFITVLIFSAWLFIILPRDSSPALAEEGRRNSTEVSPFTSLRAGISNSLEFIFTGFSEFKREVDQSLSDFFPASDNMEIEGIERNMETFEDHDRNTQGQSSTSTGVFSNGQY